MRSAQLRSMRPEPLAMLYQTRRATGFDPYAPHLFEDRVVVRVWWVDLGEFREQREIRSGAELFYLVDWRRLHVPIGIDPTRRRQVRLAPSTEGRSDQSVLEFVHDVVIGFAVGLRAPDDPADRGRTMNEHRSCREWALPARLRDRKQLRARPRTALARALENVGPRVEHRQEIIR